MKLTELEVVSTDGGQSHEPGRAHAGSHPVLQSYMLVPMLQHTPVHGENKQVSHWPQHTMTTHEPLMPGPCFLQNDPLEGSEP